MNCNIFARNIFALFSDVLVHHCSAVKINVLFVRCNAFLILVSVSYACNGKQILMNENIFMEKTKQNLSLVTILRLRLESGGLVTVETGGWGGCQNGILL